MPHFALHLILVLACAATSARADVFAYEDGQGVLVVSDRATDTRARLLIRDPSTAVPHRSQGGTRPSEEIIRLLREVAQTHALDADLLHAVVSVESGFNARAVSPKGARGLMQLMPATAARFGVADPLDPRQNLIGGARYLRLLIDRFSGDIPLALAAYNAGEGAVERHGTQIPPYAETQRYVPLVLATRDERKSRR
jgi:soluble lytic murein transglycosylase-like protein